VFAIVIGSYKLLKRHSRLKRKAPAHSRALLCLSDLDGIRAFFVRFRCVGQNKESVSQKVSGHQTHHSVKIR